MYILIKEAINLAHKYVKYFDILQILEAHTVIRPKNENNDEIYT